MCVFMYTCICLCVHTCQKKPFFFFCVFALLSVLTLPLTQKQFHLLESALYLSIALRQRFLLRSDSRPLRLPGLRWLPQ